VKFVEKTESNTVLFEILQACENMDLNCFSITETKAHNNYAAGYTVSIKAFLDSVHKQEVLAIAKKHGLSAREEKQALIIFRPENDK
jgi:hypothetical protein